MCVFEMVPSLFLGGKVSTCHVGKEVGWLWKRWAVLNVMATHQAYHPVILFG